MCTVGFTTTFERCVRLRCAASATPWRIFRLGGPHAAASGGILRWKSAKWPLAVVAQPDLTEEIAAMRKRCIAACRTGVWQAFARHDVTFKKDSLRRGTTLASRGPTHPAAGGESSSCLTQPRLVFVDKTGPSTNLLRLRGRVIRGEGPVDSIRHGRWKTITLLAGLHHDAIVASL
jgi:hypothetical protein